MKEEKLDQFLLRAIVADQYLTKREKLALAPYPIDFSRPWWESPYQLARHFDSLIETYSEAK